MIEETRISLKPKFWFLLFLTFTITLVSFLNRSPSIFLFKKTNLYDSQVFLSGIFNEFFVILGLYFAYEVFKIIKSNSENLNSKKFYFILIALFTSNITIHIPFFSIQFSSGNFPWNHWSHIFNFSITYPLAGMLFICLTWKLFIELNIKIPLSIFYSIIFFISFIRIILNDSFTPKLEDEVAYYIQHLIFKNQSLMQELNSTIDFKRMSEIMQIPYILFRDNKFFSAHHHGFSFILYVFSFINITNFTNLIFYIASFFLFKKFIETIFPFRKNLKLFALGLYLCSAVHLELSTTFMSHIASLFFLILFHLIFIQKSSLRFFLLPMVAIVSFFIRPQSFLPTIFSLIIVESVFLILLKRNRKNSLLNIFILGFSILISVGFWKLYTQNFPIKTFFFTDEYFNQFFSASCQRIGFGEGVGCFATIGTVGHSFSKLCLVLLQEFSFLSHELGLLNLPFFSILIYLIIRNYKFIASSKKDLSLLLILFLNLILFGSYWHDGGESYQGRYLVDSSYAFFLIIPRLFLLEIRKFSQIKMIGMNQVKMRNYIILLLSLMSLLNLFQSRGAYLNSGSPSYSRLNNITNLGLKNAIIGFKTSDEALVLEGYRRFKSEFDSNKIIEFSDAQIKSFENIGNGNLYATVKKIDKNGFLIDEDENLLLWNPTKEEIKKIGEIYPDKKIIFVELVKNSGFNLMTKRIKKFYFYQELKIIE